MSFEKVWDHPVTVRVLITTGGVAEIKDVAEATIVDGDVIFTSEIQGVVCYAKGEWRAFKTPKRVTSKVLDDGAEDE